VFLKSSNKKLIKTGKVIEAKGLRGEVRVLFFSGDGTWASKIKNVYLTELHTPYKVEKISATSKSDRICIKLKEINDRTSAENLKGVEIFIDEKEMQSFVGEEIFLREILDFTVLDGKKTVGKVQGFDSNTAQDLMLLEKPDGKVALIPFVNEFIVKIDFKNLKVFMDLPEGLLSEELQETKRHGEIPTSQPKRREEE
jgi:16S rRNA processing protein RimM